MVIFLIGGIIAEVVIELFLLDSPVLTVVGAILVAIGGLIIYTGLLGVAYKIVADGVERGVRSAQVPVENGDGNPTPAQLIQTVTDKTDENSGRN